jgi:DNA polymerase-3 subunit delta'
MSWNSIIGQQRVKQLLQRTITSGRLAHAYLFYGPEGVGKEALALEFAKVINCERKEAVACDVCSSCRKISAMQHPDVRLVFPLPVGKNEQTGDDPLAVLTESQITEVREQLQRKAEDPYAPIVIAKANFIKINSIRAIKRESSLTQFEGGMKLFLLFQADLMNDAAANSLLKTLEEPQPDTMVILVTSSKDQLLPTIVSRCQLVPCEQLSTEEIDHALLERDKADPATATLAARLANGSYAAARQFLGQQVAEERRASVLFIKLILGRRKIDMLRMVEELTAGNDRGSLTRWLKLLQSWLRDALMLRHGNTIQTMDDEDRSGLESFISKFPDANLGKAMEAVETAIAQIDKNVYLSLLMVHLALELQQRLSETAA